MSIWPYWPVWPILLGLCAVASFWNWRAALILAVVIIAVQGVKALNLPNEHAQVVFFALYVTVGLISWFLIDRIAGYTMALVGFVYLLHLLGIIPQYPKVIIAEAVIVGGLITGAINGGQSGGLLAMVSFVHSGGSVSASGGRTGSVARDQSVPQED